MNRFQNRKAEELQDRLCASLRTSCTSETLITMKKFMPQLRRSETNGKTGQSWLVEPGHPLQLSDTTTIVFADQP